ncbi:hypothetical protein QE152_g38348 [Popillia japonica]|uniref:Uncharacterized protein n=1 Tax=Popillia japonica TaxID=7064 RepID=A0AAW1HWX5_POPJA
MDKLKPKYNLSNPNDIQELIDLLQAGVFSDIEVRAGDSEEEYEIVMNQEYRRVGRGPDTVSTMEFGPDDNQEPEGSKDDNNDELNTEEGSEHLTEQHKRDNRVAWLKGTFQVVKRV